MKASNLLILSILFVFGYSQAITLSKHSQEPARLPERTKKEFPKPSKIVKGEIPNGTEPIKASQGDSQKGPTEEYKFSPDATGPHKVEVFNKAFKS